MILMPQIFDLIASEIARYKCNELEYLIEVQLPEAFWCQTKTINAWISFSRKERMSMAMQCNNLLYHTLACLLPITRGYFG